MYSHQHNTREFDKMGAKFVRNGAIRALFAAFFLA
jgi:hypothetical protein